MGAAEQNNARPAQCHGNGAIKMCSGRADQGEVAV